MLGIWTEKYIIEALGMKDDLFESGACLNHFLAITPIQIYWQSKRLCFLIHFK